MGLYDIISLCTMPGAVSTSRMSGERADGEDSDLPPVVGLDRPALFREKNHANESSTSRLGDTSHNGRYVKSTRVCYHCYEYQSFENGTLFTVPRYPGVTHGERHNQSRDT